MTNKLYLSSPETQGKALVTAIEDGDRPLVQLDRTWFHPQGGGQKADRGTIDGIPVVGVAHNNGSVNHYLERSGTFTVGQEVEVAVDEEWRLLNGKYHLAGHLIAALVEKNFPELEAVSGHHWPEQARVEFTGNLPEPNRVKDALVPALAEAIEADLPVRIYGDPFTNRSIAIGDFAAVPCGGTHPERLGILGKVEIAKVKAKQGKLRVSYRL